VQLWYDLSDPGMEGLLYAVESVRLFCGLRLSGPLPDETTILRFRHLLERHTIALLAGSDCPALGAAAFRQVAEWLDGGADAVLAPALDGGYVLIGLRRLEPSLFAGMAWGTDRVLAETRRRFAALGWEWRETEPLPDIDRPEDLVHLGPDLAALVAVRSD